MSLLDAAQGISKYPNADQGQRDTHKQGQDGLDPFVAEGVPFVPWFAPGSNAYQQDQVGAEVGNAMDGIGDNGLAVTENTGNELETS